MQHEFIASIYHLKNVGISVEEPVLESVRIEAATRNSSVSRMGGGMPAEKIRHDDVCARAMREALRFDRIPFEGSYLSRDEANDRAGLW